MIVTPKELEKWSKSGKDLTVLDIRPKKQIREFPLVKLNHIKGTPDTIKNLEGEIVLICQFGIITEGMIIENNLNRKKDILIFVESKKSQINLRLKKRKNYNKKILENLRKLQKKLSYKKKICDYIIKNDFKFLTVKKKVKLIKKNILNERNSIRY